MSAAPQVSAAAASDAYKDRPQSDVEKRKQVFLNGQEYRVFGCKVDSKTGFHGTAYQNSKTHNVIIAYRGTDPDIKQHTRTTLQDALVDATMVRDKINPQKVAADAFTQEVLRKAADLGIPKDHITVAGHSLGGTLAEIEAAKNGLHGVTINAYGAVDLGYNVPPGGRQVINCVMAGDVVSAASRHFGEVKILASQADIEGLRAGRYLGRSPGAPPPNPLLAMSLGDHSATHFTGEGGMENALAPANMAQYEARYAQNKVAFDHFRSDVQQDRAELATAINRTDSRNLQTTWVNLSPHLQQQLAEYHAMHVDAPIKSFAEHNRAVEGVKSGLDYCTGAVRTAGHAMQALDERLAAGARTAGAHTAPFSPAAPLAGVVLGEAAHLHGAAAHAVSDFAAGQIQATRHAVEHSAHIAGEVAKGTVHRFEAAAVTVADANVGAYQVATTQAHALGERATHAYVMASHAVSQGVHNVEQATDRAYDTLAHPGQWLHHALPGAASQTHSTSPPLHPQAQAITPSDSNHARNDPRHPDNPDHALYNELHRRIPEASENRLMQFTAACHANKITAGNLSSVHLNEASMKIGFAGTSFLSNPAIVDLSTPPPQLPQSIQHIQHYDQQQTQVMGQINTQISHTNAHAQPGLGPTLGGR